MPTYNPFSDKTPSPGTTKEKVVALVVSTSTKTVAYIVTLPLVVADVPEVTVNCEELAVATVYTASAAVPEVKSSHTRSPTAKVLVMVTVIVVVVCEYVPEVDAFSANTMCAAVVTDGHTIPPFKRIRPLATIAPEVARCVDFTSY